MRDERLFAQLLLTGLMGLILLLASRPATTRSTESDRAALRGVSIQHDGAMLRR